VIDIYWICFVGGAVFAVLLVLFDAVVGGWIDSVLDMLPDVIHPISVVGGLVTFGGAGILFTEYSAFGGWAIVLLSLLLAIALSMLLFFFYVKPMSEAESSIAYSRQELPGKIGVVTVPIPAGGFGEVEFTFGHGRIHEIASSTEDEELRAGDSVLAIEIKDHVVIVCRWTEGM
jgi:membrane protein implicated in regulation of membrane protease activity